MVATADLESYETKEIEEVVSFEARALLGFARASLLEMSWR